MKRIISALIVLIGFIAFFFWLFTLSGQSTSNEGEANVFVHLALQDSLTHYRQDTGSYPTTFPGLKALLTAPKGVVGWHGPYILGDSIPKDPWGHAYRYACPGVHNPQSYDIWSLGPNNGENPDEFIGNWK
jgi:general secretion pathway protein G